MAAPVPPQQQYASPSQPPAYTYSEKPTQTQNDKFFLQSPIWVLGVRIATCVLGLIIVGLSGYLIHGYYEHCLGYAIVCVCFLEWNVIRPAACLLT